MKAFFSELVAKIQDPFVENWMLRQVLKPIVSVLSTIGGIIGAQGDTVDAAGMFLAAAIVWAFEAVVSKLAAKYNLNQEPPKSNE